MTLRDLLGATYNWQELKCVDPDGETLFSGHAERAWGALDRVLDARVLSVQTRVEFRDYQYKSYLLAEISTR